MPKKKTTTRRKAPRKTIKIKGYKYRPKRGPNKGKLIEVKGYDKKVKIKPKRTKKRTTKKRTTRRTTRRR